VRGEKLCPVHRVFCDERVVEEDGWPGMFSHSSTKRLWMNGAQTFPTQYGSLQHLLRSACLHFVPHRLIAFPELLDVET